MTGVDLGVHTAGFVKFSDGVPQGYSVLVVTY